MSVLLNTRQLLPPYILGPLDAEDGIPSAAGNTAFDNMQLDYVLCLHLAARALACLSWRACKSRFGLCTPGAHSTFVDTLKGLTCVESAVVLLIYNVCTYRFCRVGGMGATKHTPKPHFALKRSSVLRPHT